MITAIESAETTSVCYLLEEQGHALLIDPNDFSEIQSILSASRSIPELIFLTHEHFDHILALEEAREYWKIPVLASRPCSDALGDESANLSNIYDLFVYFRTGVLARTRHRAFRCNPAEIVYELTCEYRWLGHRFLFRSCPGHSPGSSVILMDDTVLFSGDYLIYGEAPNLELRTGDPEAFRTDTAPWLEQLPEGLKVYPGHGIPYTLKKEDIANDAG